MRGSNFGCFYLIILVGKSNRLKLLQTLVAISCLINGLLAGEDVYRYVIEVPAWRYLDVSLWAEYSRHADLGNGIFLFPIEALLGAILACIAAIIVMRNSTYRPAATAVYATALLVLTGIGFTFFAAPQMLQLRSGNIPPEQVQQIFNNFHYWGKWRAVAQILSFIANLVALKRVYSITIKK
jgi:hypothetical protein